MTSRLRRLTALTGVATMVALAPCTTAAADPSGDPTAPPVPGASAVTGPPAVVPGVPAAPPAPGVPPEPGAAAAPVIDPAGDSATISLANLGSSDTIWFGTRRDTTTSTISFNVPRGLTPTALNATLELPISLKAGYLAVTQNGKTIHRQQLPKEDGAALVIPLTGAEVFNDWTSITLTVTALPDAADQFCWHPAAPIRLVKGSITFTGAMAPPGTVADFLPSSPSRITIGIPMKPSQAETAAAIQLAAAMTANYGWKKTEISVIPITGGVETFPPAVPLERQIWLKEAPDKGLTLIPRPGGPALYISGPGEELTNQTRLLTDPQLAFAVSSKAIAEDLTPTPVPLLTTATLEKLKQRVNDSEEARPQVQIKIDQTVFGQSLAGVRVHVLGSYTPLAANFSGDFTAEIGNEVLDRWPANAEGTIDRWVDIPNHSLGRVTQLTIAAHTMGDPGHCNDYLNMTLRIDPSTEIVAQRASPPIPPGFRSFPQTLMPTVVVGLEPGSAPDTVRAARIVGGLQRGSTVPLNIEVSNVQDALASGKSAVLISPNGWTDQTFALPFNADLGHITIEGLDPGGNPAKLTLDPPVKFGSLQTVFDGQRSLLVATSNGAPAQLDELLRWLDAVPNRWTDLDGRAILSVPFNAPLTVPNRRGDLPDDEQGVEKSGLLPSGWPWLVASAIAAAALVGAVLIMIRSRKQRPVAAAEHVTLEETLDADRPVTDRSQIDRTDEQ